MSENLQVLNIHPCVLNECCETLRKEVRSFRFFLVDC